MKDLPKFEKSNNIKINVFNLVKNKPTVLYNSRDRDINIPVCNLLLLEEQDKAHFVLIRDLGRLVCDNADQLKKS